MGYVPVPPPPAARRSFWSQYGKWILTGLVVVGVGFVCLIVAIFMGVSAALKHSDAAALAVKTAAADPRVGGPLTVSKVGGNINTDNGAGKASLEISVTGPHGAGVLYADEVRADDEWRVTTLDYKAAGSEESTRIYPVDSAP